MEPEVSAAEMLRGHLDVSGRCTASDLARVTGLGASSAALALVRLETEGFALRGRFSDPDGPEEWCARRVLTRIHAYSRQRKRREVEPVTAQDFMRFLLRWQHVTPDTRVEGSLGGLAVVWQLKGFELAAGAWEKAVLPARVTGYRKEWLDEVCLDGGVAWGRLFGARLRALGRAAQPGPDPVPGHPDHAGDPRRPAVAAGGGPRFCVPGVAWGRGGPGTCSTRSPSAARCSRPTWPP